MAINRIGIIEFLNLAKANVVLDVRSPSEYAHAHIPNALSLPLFNDNERKIVGTAYKQESRENAIKIGLDYFGPNMRNIVEEVELLTKVTDNKPASTKTVLLHCWRGGMRSGAIAWLLDFYGFQVILLDGGYKAYRNWVLASFEKKYEIKIIGGFTGSGKTPLLHALAKNNCQTIDLEGLANHKGSALGGIGQEPQPSQEMFENRLANQLADIITNKPVFIEDESQRIGNLQVPPGFYAAMQSSQVYYVDIDFEQRLNYLTKEYGLHPQSDLVNAVMRIQKRLGGLETKNAVNFLLENNHKEAFRILLKYYDKWYSKGLFGRENAETLITTIKVEKVDAELSCKSIMRVLML
jgi:tRNA 2-selenouridine synthase